MVEENAKETAVAAESTVKTDDPKTEPKESKREETSLKEAVDSEIDKLDDEHKLDLGDATLVLSAEDEVEIAAQAYEEINKSESAAMKVTVFNIFQPELKREYFA